MKMFAALPLPRTVAGQLTGVVIGAVLVGVCLASAVMFYLVWSGGVGPSRQTLAQIRAARMAAIVRHVYEKRSTGEDMFYLKHVSAEPVSVRQVKAPPPADQARAPTRQLVSDVEDELRNNWEIQVLPHGREGADVNAIYVAVDPTHILRFEVTPFGGTGSLVMTQTLCTLGVITFIILFVSAFAVRSITAPLRSIASAARAFGRSGGETDRDLAEIGPVEVVQAARALNDMRKRVRTLVDERTRMLVAVSHDLRTPLTRLRLRVERLRDDPSKQAMLGEIATVNEMLAETLAYMREAGQSEAASPTDLPSLLQTIAGQFADTGHDVSYRGPDRLMLSCRPHALTRAVNNLVDNATKFGARVEIAVEARGERVYIEVSDDGPGIPANLLDRVFEPFFKGDHARGQQPRTGFGLGLSIVREIVEGQGGAVELLNRAPQGLLARIMLPVKIAPREAAAA
jgi:signal transduction histidine kinase